ncbi:hypothetical protein DOTSEDRAFT_91483 [Dothistroma septosporum NZE10]|uniref:FAD-binding PCMH-type domain-containing protein n=1 Tax=Dothistroma septosporum (strain NZE10 / CBS 128990) TaxID=675120 RepID=N1PD64_DOTSN|nr:hypothetical protein DOTSEDRAFT_91483 [Dothistroma septosporum NZE10]
MSSIVDAFSNTITGIAHAQANSPFQQCIRHALGNHGKQFAFPQDILYQAQDVHPYNLDHPLIPAAVVYPKTSDEVSDVVICAHDAGIAVQPRSGGHGYCNYGLGGENGALSVDMKHFKDFNYNKDDHSITCGPGNRLGDLTDKLKPLDRVMAYGPSRDIGAGGHMTIGGIGVLGRQLGLGADQVISVDCVLGNGSQVTATESTNSDLYFAIRGAGFNFGIVTSFRMQTAPAPREVTQFAYNITAGKATDLADTFKQWQKFIAQPDLTRKFGCTLTLTEGLLIFGGTYFGPRSDFNQLNIEAILPNSHSRLNVHSSIVTETFNEIGALALDLFGKVPAHFYAKSLKTTPKTLLSDDAVDAMFEYIEKTDKGTHIWFVTWDLEGGKISDVPQKSSAYWNRDALYFLQSYVVSLLDDVGEKSKKFLDGLNKVVQEKTGADESAYPGYVDERLSDPHRSYWGGNVPRLQEIKAAVDPDNVFRNPQSIKPAKRS